MADTPHFTHIHCSSRFDRSAESLETDLDEWMDKSSLITVTEVKQNNRASRLREKGWRYYNAKGAAADSDNCAIAWKTEDWHQRAGKVLKLTDHPYKRGYTNYRVNIWAATVVLRRTDTGHSLLCSVCHMPAHVQGSSQHWRTDLDEWMARKQAYLTALTGWSKHVKDLERKHNTDGSLIVADWNLNLKDHWVRALLNDHWGDQYDQAWKHFPTAGGSLGGERIIDGTLFRDLMVTGEPDLMERVRSSDHRPYKESFRFLGKAEKPVKATDGAQGNSVDPANTFHGREWWGFGDYADDELFDVDRVFD